MWTLAIKTFVFCSLKFMHVIALLTGDDFLLQFPDDYIRLGNYSDFDAQMNKAFRYLHGKHSGTWLQRYSYKLAFTVTKWGFCVTFNLPTSDKMFHLNKLELNQILFFNFQFSLFQGPISNFLMSITTG